MNIIPSRSLWWRSVLTTDFGQISNYNRHLRTPKFAAHNLILNQVHFVARVPYIVWYMEFDHMCVYNITFCDVHAIV